MDGIEPVVSTGVDITVSDGVVIDVSVMGGESMSEPVEFSGVSQPIMDIAKKAMKRMLFM